MSTLTLGGSTLANKTGSVVSINDGVILPAGSVLDVKTSNKNTTAYITGTSAVNWQDISDLSVNITPRSNSKVLVLINLMVGGKANHNNLIRIARGTTGIGVGVAASSRPAASYSFRSHNDYQPIPISGHFYDESPGGNGSTELTYKIQFSAESSYSIYVNRPYSEGDSYYYGRYNSSITVIEVAG